MSAQARLEQVRYAVQRGLSQRRACALMKYLAVVDEYTRECLAIDVAGSIRSKRVIDVLSQLISVHGAPRYLR